MKLDHNVHFLAFLAAFFAFFGAAFLATFLAAFFGAALFGAAFLAAFGAALLATTFLAAVKVKEGKVIIKCSFNVLNIFKLSRHTLHFNHPEKFVRCNNALVYWVVKCNGYCHSMKVCAIIPYQWLTTRQGSVVTHHPCSGRLRDAPNFYEIFTYQLLAFVFSLF